jgi:phosphate transport system ATP-binding protein
MIVNINEQRTVQESEMDMGKIVFSQFNLWYGAKHVLKDISFSISSHLITAVMGPSGCGKSTLLRTIDRMNDIIP